MKRSNILMMAMLMVFGVSNSLFARTGTEGGPGTTMSIPKPNGCTCGTNGNGNTYPAWADADTIKQCALACSGTQITVPNVTPNATPKP